MEGLPKGQLSHNKSRLYHSHTYCFPVSSQEPHVEDTILTSPISQGKGTCPRSHSEKQTQDCVTTVPTLPTGPPCSLWQALGLAFRRHPIVVPLFPSLESTAQALAFRSWGKRQRSQGEGSVTGTRGCTLARAKQSPPPPAPAPGCLLSPQVGTPGQPAYPAPAHPCVHHSCKLDLGACSLPCRHKAHSAEPDTVPAFELFAVSGED